MVTLTQEQIKNYWIVSMTQDSNSYSNGAMQSWGSPQLPDGYAFVPRDDEDAIMNEYYKKTDENGKQLKSAGHVDMEYDDCQDEEGNLLGKIVTKCTFSMEKYNAYRASLPSEIPGIVNGKISNATSECATQISEGTTPNSVMATTTFLNIDGETLAEVPVYRYNEDNQAKLQSAVIAVTNGSPYAKLTFEGAVAQKFNKEQILTMYLELEMFKAEKEFYRDAYIAMVNKHKDDDRNTADELEAKYEYGCELEPEYQAMYDANMNDKMEELQAMRSFWGIDQ